MDWKVVLSSFCILFLAELGDKTQLAVFTLVTQNKRPISVFIGASFALTLVTFIGAFFGNIVTKYIPTYILKLLSGILFLVIGAFIIKDAIPETLKMI